jgi:RHS repeat-associated protein
MVRLTDSATGQIVYRIAPDFEWNSATNRAQIRIQLAGRVIAIHDTPHDPNIVPGGCSGSPSALTPFDPAGFAGLFAPAVIALLGLALIQARRRRAEAGLRLSPAAASPRLALSWRVGVAAATAGVFVLVISIPVPLFGPGTASAVSPSNVTYFHGDHLGSSVVVTGDVYPGDQLRHVIFRPYGGVVAETAGGSTEPPKVGFTGQRFEASAGLHDYGARWYDSNLGRFLQPDSIVPEPFNPQSLNRYSYVLNDPVNRIDPTGRFSLMSESASSGGWVFSGYESPFGYDPFGGYGVYYYYGGGGGSGSSPHPSASFSEGTRQSQVPSGITAESFTFSQTTPVQPGHATAESGQEGVQIACGPATPVCAWIILDALAKATVAAAAALGTAAVIDEGSRLLAEQLDKGDAGAEDRNPAQDKPLSKGEIKALEDGKVDVHDLKGGKQTGQSDLYKDKRGNIYVKPKGGAGPGEPTGLNIKDFM